MLLIHLIGLNQATALVYNRLNQSQASNQQQQQQQPDIVNFNQVNNFGQQQATAGQQAALGNPQASMFTNGMMMPQQDWRQSTSAADRKLISDHLYHIALLTH